MMFWGSLFLSSNLSSSRSLRTKNYPITPTQPPMKHWAQLLNPDRAHDHVDRYQATHDDKHSASNSKDMCRIALPVFILWHVIMALQQ